MVSGLAYSRPVSGLLDTNADTSRSPSQRRSTTLLAGFYTLRMFILSSDFFEGVVNLTRDWLSFLVSAFLTTRGVSPTPNIMLQPAI